MIRDITIKDDDQGREYHMQARFRCCDDTDGRVCCDVDGIELESCVVWLGDCGCEVDFGEHRSWWQREVERKYADEIAAACIEVWEAEQREAA